MSSEDPPPLFFPRSVLLIVESEAARQCIKPHLVLLHHVEITTVAAPRQNHKLMLHNVKSITDVAVCPILKCGCTTSKPQVVLNHVKITTDSPPHENHSWRYATSKLHLMLHHIKTTAVVALHCVCTMSKQHLALHHVKIAIVVVPRQNHNWSYTTSKPQLVVYHIKIRTGVAPLENRNSGCATSEPQLELYHVKITTGGIPRQNHNRCCTTSESQLWYHVNTTKSGCTNVDASGRHQGLFRTRRDG